MGAVMVEISGGQPRDKERKYMQRAQSSRLLTTRTVGGHFSPSLRVLQQRALEKQRTGSDDFKLGKATVPAIGGAHWK
jgi:hypothetical protein